MLETTNVKQPPSRRLLPPVLPEELIFEILRRLPVRSLLRLKCVCKSWKTLISHPQFKKDHFHTSISITSMTHQQLVSLTNDEWKEMVTCSVQSLFKNPSTPAETLCLKVEPKDEIIIGSCNGLLCLCDYNGDFRLWNPSTRLTSKRSPDSFWRARSITHIGFGYDQVNDKYKVLIAVWGYLKFTTRVHTFGTISWKTIQNPPFSPISRLFSPESRYKEGKFVRGTLNWLALISDGSGRLVIISFDMEKETFSEVLLPPQYDGDNNHTLDVLSNNLCLHYFNESHWVVWLMKKHDMQESWTKLMVIPHDRDCTTKLFLRPLCISANGIIILAKSEEPQYLSDKQVDPQLVLYNPNNDTFDYPKIRGSFRHDLHIYHESLVSPSCYV